MDKIILGDTNIEVSQIGLGTVKFGRNHGLKYPKPFNLPPLGHCRDILSLAKELGITVLDTAPAYGHSEERLGQLLEGHRQDWVIISKAGEDFDHNQSHFDFSPAHIQHSLYRSLERLQTDYLDIFLIHSDGNDMSNLSDEIIETMQNLKRQGVVRAIGASTKTVEGGIRCLDEMDIAMVAYNPDYTDEKYVLDYAATRNKGIFLKKVFSSGHAIDPAESLRFSLSHSCGPCAIIGTITPEHLKANCMFQQQKL